MLWHCLAEMSKTFSDKETLQMYRSTDCVRHRVSLALRPQNAASVISKDVVISETRVSFPVNKVLPFLNHIYLCVFYA